MESLDGRGAEDFNHVPLLVQRVEVCYVTAAIIGGILDCKGSALGIVGEDHDLGRAAAADLLINDLAVQRAVLMRDAAHLFIGANAVGVVSVGRRPAAGRDMRELPPVFPRQAGVGRPVIPVFGLAAERPRLPREAVIAVVDVLRALHRAAVGVQLRTADQAAEGVVLEAIARKLARRIAVAQPCQRAFCVVSIGNVTTAIIRLPDQSVKPAALSRANVLA